MKTNIDPSSKNSNLDEDKATLQSKVAAKVTKLVIGSRQREAKRLWSWNEWYPEYVLSGRRVSSRKLTGVLQG
jgi:hypothetical protein